MSEQTILKETNPRARKTHQCSLCHGLIRPNELYNRLTIAYDGTVDDFLTCAACQDDGVIERVSDWSGNYHDIGVGFDDAQEWAHENLREDSGAGLDEIGAATDWRARFLKGQQYEQETRKEPAGA